jgi:hypothetical protein
MTEADWLACTDPDALRNVLWESGKASDRKRRLYTIACCRRVWPRLSRGAHRVVEAAERVADGLADRRELEKAVQASGAIRGSYRILHPVVWPTMRHVLRAPKPGESLSEAVVLLVTVEASPAAVTVSRAGQFMPHIRDTAWKATEGWLSVLWKSVKRGRPGEERRGQCALLRDIFGTLPFRPLPPPSVSLLRWGGGTVVQLARALYEERLFEDMPVLGDALEEAGVTDPDVLCHCRQQGEHARGCWVVDWLLGRG